MKINQQNKQIWKLRRYCEECNKITIHSDHGFRDHNYREICTICGHLNYAEGYY